jgi:hypothetical protein
VVGVESGEQEFPYIVVQQVALALARGSGSRSKELGTQKKVVFAMEMAVKMAVNRSSGVVLKCRPAPPRTPSRPFVKDQARS